MTRTCSLLLAAVLVCAAATEASAACPWRTVANVDDPTIQSFGKWAVEQNFDLRFDRVVSAKAQATGDCANNINRYYELMIDASNRVGPGDDRYKAVVYVEQRTHPKQLISFGR
ncbi:hypothetical protein QOZ80_5AG0385470 [Eleusine coracana subsp. coracana]|nr:hypothetical protein QOZ80_5AG0385470 [Eleusine coracana subsp. coracana]